MTDIERVISEFSDFRRALRREDQEYFDRAVEMARKHAEAARAHHSINPVEMLIMCMMVEVVKEMEKRKREGQ